MTELTSTPVPAELNSSPVTTEIASTPVAVVASWDEQKEKLKAKFPILTDADLTYEEGKKDAMMDGIQIKLGKTKDELTALIAAL